MNERGQTRLRCADGWTSATASTGTVLFEPLSTTRSPVPRRSALGSPLATVSEEDDGSGAEDVLLEEETAMDPMQEVDAAVQLATKIETWLADIPIGGKMPRRFDSAGLIQFGEKRLSPSCPVAISAGWCVRAGIESKLYHSDPESIYEKYVESMVANSPHACVCPP